MTANSWLKTIESRLKHLLVPVGALNIGINSLYSFIDVICPLKEKFLKRIPNNFKVINKI